MLAADDASAEEMSQSYSAKRAQRPRASAGSGASRSREDKRTLTRRRILRAARTEFARGGLEGVAVKTIAERVGVANGTVFWHFESKTSLYLETVTLASDEFHGELLRLIDGHRVSFMQVIDKAVAFLRSHPEIDRLLSSLRGEHPCDAVSEATRLVEARSVSVWRRWIAVANQRSPLLPSASDANLARLIAVTVSSLFAMRLPEEDLEVPRALLADFAALIESSAPVDSDALEVGGSARD